MDDVGGNDDGEAHRLEFQCQYCERRFSSKAGRSIHVLRKHPVEYNRGIVVERARGRWSEEEARVMASLEADGIRLGTRFLNQYLVRLMPGRTLEAIKGKRRDPQYRNFVRELVEGHPGEAMNRAADQLAEPVVLPRNVRPIEETLPDVIERLAREILWECLGDRAEALRVLINGCRRQCITVPLLRWIRDTLPPGKALGGNDDGHVRPRLEPDISRRDRRRREYRLTQELYRKSEKLCVGRILDGESAPPEMATSKEEFHEYWRGVWEAPAQEYMAPALGDPIETHDQLWGPVSSS